MGWIQDFFAKRARRTIRKLPRIERGGARFRQRYPGFAFGTGSYGLPLVHDWQEGSTLSIGAYCSIAEGVQIFLGGHHRADWVTTYPFPAMLPEAEHFKGHVFSRGDVVIGSDVWLYSNGTILPGVTIGYGALGHTLSEAPYVDSKQTTSMVIGACLAKGYGCCVLRSA